MGLFVLYGFAQSSTAMIYFQPYKVTFPFLLLTQKYWWMITHPHLRASGHR